MAIASSAAARGVKDQTINELFIAVGSVLIYPKARSGFAVPRMQTHKQYPMCRQSLIKSAHAIAALRGEPPYSPWVVLRKIFIQEHRDWSKPGAPHIKWKRGEIIEFLQARTNQERVEEWGDIGYYIAQTWGWLWQLYRFVTPESIIRQAVEKFQRRSKMNIR